MSNINLHDWVLYAFARTGCMLLLWTVSIHMISGLVVGGFKTSSECVLFCLGINFPIMDFKLFCNKLSAYFLIVLVI
jgi:hypothetical protein